MFKAIKKFFQKGKKKNNNEKVALTQVVKIDDSVVEDLKMIVEKEIVKVRLDIFERKLAQLEFRKNKTKSNRIKKKIQKQITELEKGGV